MTDKPAQPNPPVPQRTRSSVKLALIISLAINLLIIGVIAGGLMTGRRPMALGGFDMTLGPFTESMDRRDRDAIRERLGNHHNLRQRNDRDLAINAFLAALKTEPFDPAAIEALFAEQRELATSGMAAGQDALLERLMQMAPEQRAQFAQRLESRLGARHDRRP